MGPRVVDARVEAARLDRVEADDSKVFLADGTELAAQKLRRVLTNDPGTGVLRHVDAGYERAIEVAEAGLGQ